MRNLIQALVSTFNIRQQHDAVITWIIPGPPSEKAGLQKRDVVTAVFGQPVDSTTKLQNRIALMQMGGLVSLDILRDGISIYTNPEHRHTGIAGPARARSESRSHGWQYSVFLAVF